MSALEKADVLDQLNTAVLVVDHRLTVRYLNAAAEALLGCSLSRSLGASVGELLSPADAGLIEGLDQGMGEGRSVTRRAAQFHTRDGQEVVADLTVSHPPGSSSRILELQPVGGLIRITRDDHARFSRETARRLARGIAHEVKNPLGGVRGAAQLLERELLDPHLREYTRVIIDEADRLKELVDRMLGPNQAPAREPVNVHAVIEHVLRLVDAEAAGTISVQRDYDPSLPPVQGDEAQLTQALLNVAINAVQATEGRPDPAIRVRTRVMRRFTIDTRLHRIVLRIDLIDNGCGIPEDMLKRMYFPMISGRADGTGLGLAITQAIVAQHGGVLECESRPGRTCFSVFLPVEECGHEQ